MKFYTDEKIDFINSLLLSYGYWQKMHALNTNRTWVSNEYRRRFEMLMKSHAMHPFFSKFKAISDMNPPPQAFMQMILYFNDDCASCISGVSESDVIPPQLDTQDFTKAMADLRLKFAYSVVVEKTKDERKHLVAALDNFAGMKGAKFVTESVFPSSARTADPELVVSPLSSGNFTFNAGGKNFIIVSPECSSEGKWIFNSKQNLHTRYFLFKLEDSIRGDVERFVSVMKRGRRDYADKAYSIKSGLDDRQALLATVRQSLSAYLLAAETSNEVAVRYLSRAMKRGLGLVSPSYNILCRTFSKSADGTFNAEQFYSDLSAYIEKTY